MAPFKVYQDQENVAPAGVGRKGKVDGGGRRTALKELDGNRKLEKRRKSEDGDEGRGKRNREENKKDAICLVGCTWYRKDIYQYLRSIEGKHWPKPGFMYRQSALSLEMRSILVDWLVDVNLEFSLPEEVLHTAVLYIDRFLNRFSVAQSKFQLVGVSAILLAAKFEAIYYPSLRELVYITDEAYTENQVLVMEALLIRGLDYELTATTAYVFLQHVGWEAWLDKSTLHLASYLLELALVQGEPYFQFMPSLIAAGCIALARYCLGTSVWPQRLSTATGYSWECLLPILPHLNSTHDSVSTWSISASREKYSSNKYSSVSSIIHIDLEDNCPK